MATTFVQSRSTTLSTISPELAVVGLFSLTGLTLFTLFAAVLSYVSDETIGMMFSSIG